VDALVFVEGISDRVALETLAKRRARDLDAERVEIVPIGGAQALGRFVDRLRDVRVAGLCDAGEERSYARALERAGLGSRLTRADMEGLGFYVCETDLEDELIRANGAEVVLRIAETEGDLASFQTFQKQLEHREKTVEAQLHRWMGNRKIRYARLLVEALDLNRVPRPLDRVLAHV
jgi:Overcoming lysogenization defect protein-like, TOPRIM domain